VQVLLLFRVLVGQVALQVLQVLALHVPEAAVVLKPEAVQQLAQVAQAAVVLVVQPHQAQPEQSTQEAAVVLAPTLAQVILVQRVVLV
jgi:hypothetical protein